MASDLFEEAHKESDTVCVSILFQPSSPAQPLIAHNNEKHPRNFPQLPGEVRNKIYEQVILEGGTFGLGPLIEPALARTSHDIAVECSSLFYELRRFDLTERESLYSRFPSACIANYPEDRIQAMRRFSIWVEFNFRHTDATNSNRDVHIAIDLQTPPDTPKVWLAKHWGTPNAVQPLEKYWIMAFMSRAEGLSTALDKLQSLFQDMAKDGAVTHFTRENLLQIVDVFHKRQPI